MVTRTIITRKNENYDENDNYIIIDFNDNVHVNFDVLVKLDFNVNVHVIFDVLATLVFEWCPENATLIPYTPYSKMAANRLFFCLHVN